MDAYGVQPRQKSCLLLRSSSTNVGKLALTLPLLLATLLATTLLMGCQTLPPKVTTPSTAPALAAKLEAQVVRDVCTKLWLGQPYDSELDTPETVRDAKANNARRAKFCTGV